MANFESRLRDLRKQNKITQAELAQKLSIGGFEFSPSTVGMWEQGRRTPQLDTIDLIADFFNWVTKHTHFANSNKNAAHATNMNGGVPFGIDSA